MSHEEFESRLRAELETLTIELNSIAKQDPTTNDWLAVPIGEDLVSADENVEADAVEEWNERRALVSELETRYRNVKRATDKIANGTYGICEISGEPIEENRLDANPAARTNIANIDKESELPL